MADGIVDRILPQISYSGGNKELRTVKSVSVDESDEKTAVETINRDREPLGFTRGVKKTGLTVETVRLKGELEVDWRALKESGEVFRFSFPEEDGQRISAKDCVVDSVTLSYPSSGEVAESVKMKARGTRTR